jgi:SnoaL-like domain
MSKHLTISPAEAADRLAMRELVQAYAHCADRRDAKGQMSLFVEDTHFVVYMNARDPSLHRNCARATRSLPCSQT